MERNLLSGRFADEQNAGVRGTVRDDGSQLQFPPDPEPEDNSEWYEGTPDRFKFSLNGLKQWQLSLVLFRAGKADAEADQADRLSCAREGFVKQRAKLLERWLQSGALDGRAGEIGELQFHEDFGDRAGRFFLREIRHQFLKQFRQLLFAFGQRLEIARKCFLGAERLALAVRLDRPVVDAATKIVKLDAEFAEVLLQRDARQPPHIAAGRDSQLLQLLSRHFADAPQFPDGQFFHERRHAFRFHFELAVWFFQVARNFRDQLVRPDAGGGRQFRFAKDQTAN